MILIFTFRSGCVVTSWLGWRKARKRLHKKTGNPPCSALTLLQKRQSRGCPFPTPKGKSFLREKVIKDRKTALIPVPAGLGVRAGQPTRCNSTGVLLSQSQRLLGGKLGAGQARLLRQLHKQTLNGANIRAVVFVQSGNTRGKNNLFKPPSQRREGQRHPQTAFFQRVVFCLKCHHSCAEVSSLMWPVKHIASRKFFNSPFLYDTAF